MPSKQFSSKVTAIRSMDHFYSHKTKEASITAVGTNPQHSAVNISGTFTSYNHTH